MNDQVLLFGGTEPSDEAALDSAGVSSKLLANFGMWLGAVYAMEHDVAVDPQSLAQFDPVSVMPLYHQDTQRGEDADREGLSIEQSWLMQQLLLRRPTTCVIVDQFTGQPTTRITRLRVSSAESLVAELFQRLARNFSFEGRTGWVAALEDAYFEPAEPITLGVLIDHGGHAIRLESADPTTQELFYWDPWPTGTLVPGGKPSGQEGLWRISAPALTQVIVYALVTDTPPVERSPDIYADTVRLEADPSVGAPLDVAWHATWEVAGPTYCLFSADDVTRQVERIPYRAELPGSEIVNTIQLAFQRRPNIVCVGHVRLDIDKAHSISLLHADRSQVVFHDPWPKGSLLAAGRNALGLDAQRVSDGWQITIAELERCIQAVFISPEVLAELQARVYLRSLSEVLSALAFFGIHETGRALHDSIIEVEAQPGGFQDSVLIRFAVNDDDSMEGALLSVKRSWLAGPNAPFGVDIIKSFLGATVSPLDEGETSFATRAVEALALGQDALMKATGSGPPHLLGQTRALITAILGAQDTALMTYAFTRVVARNEQGWLKIGVERSERTAGPLIVGASLPAPWAAP